MQLLENIKNAVLAYKPAEVRKLCQQALDEGIEPDRILNEGLIEGMNVIGVKFKNNEIFIPEVLIAAKATHEGLDVLRPILSQRQTETKGKVVIGTVKDDLHDIGKNLVVMMLEGAGFEVVDLGVNVSPESFVAAIEKHQPQIVGMSSLITSTLHWVEETIKAIQNAGLRDSVKIMVGGAPVTEDWAKQIGADAFGRDATAAVEAARQLLGVA
ncbi:MAG TPA: cobalamin-binding protein [Clostridia bacterium]|nr:cobalamin-binding protein [Clostridia bacterium]